MGKSKKGGGKSKNRKGYLVLALVLWPWTAHAQTQACTPAPPFPTPPPTAYTCYGTLPFKAAFDASAPLAGDVYRVHIDGPQVGADFAAVPGATAVVLTVAGLAVRAAPYVLTVGHVRPPNAEVLSTPVSITMVDIPPQPPPPPGNLRIIAELMNDTGQVLARYVILERPPAQ